MSKKFLPLAGIAAVLAIVSYLVLSFLFPHKKEVLVDTRVKPEEVFSAQLNEADAQPTASTAESSELGSTPAVETPTAATTEPAPELPAETPVVAESAPAPAEPVAEAPAETPAEAPAAAEPAPAAEAAVAETPSSSGGLSREQLAKIVAEAAAKAAAETAKAIAEQAAREAASH